ncbi:hypothetical protein EW093_08160 [Thiospirochaeta perfilievii]|uniref:Uncharacterized protein n=1 Tax=Thiospirochaeta perfilievii TaxID=252967 RepID=A0A5C1QCM2_9SPIO|nr:hypothetical protein [Thiospirochaeta perfilievii]QEN04679.1 hypothetical protein EW093_08160 [Thiospirochaeta perfilievii]
MEQKTLEEHKEYLRECTKLGLWAVADWVNKHPQEDIVEVLDERTAIVNHTVFNNKTLYDFPNFTGDEWPKLKEELKDIYKNSSNPSQFEELAFKIVEPYIYGRAEKDLQSINGGNSKSWVRYDLNKDEEYLEIHMENSLYPKSFLADEKYFYDKLKIAVLDAEKSGFKGLWTCSWLNDLPSWQKLMPKEWNESINNRRWDFEWHLGFWGQFLTANQCFNYKLGKKFRETGKIPYPMSRAKASIEVFKKHLGI